MSIRIVTDSTSYLAPEIREDYDIQVVPLQVIFGDMTFKEGYRYTNAEYFARLKQEKIFPATSQPPVGDFQEVFDRFAPDDTVICILISELLSGTVQSAEIAAQSSGLDVTVIDSRSSSAGLAFQVTRAAEMARAGASKEEIIEEVIRIRSATSLYFVVDDLQYLIRGGRLGKAGGLVGSLLQIKPILQLVDGQLIACDKVRTRQRAWETILGKLREKAQSGPLENVCVVYVDNLADALEFKERVAALYGGTIQLSELGPVIGSHTGPGTIGLVYY
jgi:DegV family protein with EDD domain